MSLESWIIDDLERERQREERVPDALELPVEEGAAPEPVPTRPRRGATIVDISPEHDNVISI